MNRHTVRSLFVMGAGALLFDQQVACGSEDDNSAAAQATGGFGFGGFPGGGFPGGGGIPIGPNGGTMATGGRRFGGGGTRSGTSTGGQTTTPCVAALCTPVSNGEPCCVGTYGPCGAMIGGQCTRTTSGGGGRTGRGSGGSGNTGGQVGNGGTTRGSGGTTQDGGGPGGAGGAGGSTGGTDASVTDGAAPPADSGSDGPG
jgi:hypothetical protein